MSSRFPTVAEAAHYLRLEPPVDLSSGSAGRDSREPRDRKWLFQVHLLDDWIETSTLGPGGVRGAPPASDLTLPEGDLFLAAAMTLPSGSDDPALEILPDALRGQAGHPPLFIATLGRLGGLAALGEGRADVAACAHVEAASGEPDLS